MAAALQSDPALDGVFCNSALVNEKLEPLNRTLWDLRRFTPNMQKDFSDGNALKVFLKRVTLSSHNIAFKRRMLEKLLPFPELSPFYPDTFIALLIAAAGKWQAMPETLTLYRIHSSNESAPVQGALSSARKARKLRAAYRNAELANIIIKTKHTQCQFADICARLRWEKQSAKSVCIMNLTKTAKLTAV